MLCIAVGLIKPIDHFKSLCNLAKHGMSLMQILIFLICKCDKELRGIHIRSLTRHP